MSPRNFQSRIELGRRMTELLDGGWTSEELLEHLAGRLEGAGSVMAVTLTKARKLPSLPPSAQARHADERLVADQRARQMEQAVLYGSRRAAVDLADDELDEDLERAFGQDIELLEAARASAAKVRGQVALSAPQGQS